MSIPETPRMEEREIFGVEPITCIDENIAEKEEVDEDDSSPRGVLEVPIAISSADTSCDGSPSHPSASSSFSGFLFDRNAFHKALIPDNYNLNAPFKGFFDAVRKNQSVKKLSTSTIALLASCDLSKKSLRQKLSRICNFEDGLDYGLLPVPKATWRNFRYSELAYGTDNFSQDRLLGTGGHAEVYRGLLADGTEAAIKKLVQVDEKEDEDERVGDFLAELGLIAHVDHPNIAQLIGFGVDRGLFLVFRFFPNGSLATHLHGSREGLEWKVRYKVAVGVAQGLCYLHHGCQRRIIHRDIKASNILLAEDFQPVISDFGLAKWLPENWLQQIVYPIEGTFGYLAPEYFMHGIVDEKTDVFAYGVLLLELITGRHAVDFDRQSLVIWARPFLESGEVTELIDPLLGTNYDPAELRCALLAASMCIHHEPTRRPFMKRVVKILLGEAGPIAQKQKSMLPRSVVMDAEGYTRTNYLNDLTRHMQLVME